uniref:Uncharacterized protein n=1 Tax=Sphaerodactylus townsendi TaxID=933632 RepID=A0ACB8EUR9_9SAUR
MSATFGLFGAPPPRPSQDRQPGRDPNWWQACHVEGGSAGLIPSQLLEEKRKAFVKRDLEVTPSSVASQRKSQWEEEEEDDVSDHKKRRQELLSSVLLDLKIGEFDRHELFDLLKRWHACLRSKQENIGAHRRSGGWPPQSGRTSSSCPIHLSKGTTIPYTSRRAQGARKQTGQVYCFVTRNEMEVDIKAGRYLEHGESMRGTSMGLIDSIHEVIELGKMCILDVNPLASSTWLVCRQTNNRFLFFHSRTFGQAVKVLRTAEFVPYVVFIEAPDFETLRAINKAALESGVATKQLTDADLKRTVDESCRIQRGYGHYFDLSLVNDNMERTFQQLQQALEKLHNEPQWVPVSWVY